ncbi:hypothetical protein AAL_00933 [Moelleriella libera RCEF 2490]|uniref:Uncharacterized protein n=1 Tax=Moelleriella libera RCEF 2490 TaxID=1081109 RepID=A0A166VB36_9HYPO|nr:hypothetical protein AAL_00933 [Moelleriella libera RCEF 2490]
MSPPPSTPTPRRFLLPKRWSSQTPAPPASQFQSTPRFGSSSVSRPQTHVEDVEEDVSDLTVSPQTSPYESEAKRRKLSFSSGPEDDEAHEGDRVQQAHIGAAADNLSDVMSSLPATPYESEAARMNLSYSSDEARDEDKPQPVFQSAPRFKAPIEETGSDFPLPLVFSPHHARQKYLPDGMAALLQSWLSEVKSLERQDPMRIEVQQITRGEGMYLARAASNEHYLLAGEGKLTGLQGRADITNGSEVLCEEPWWQVQLAGVAWTVVCNWSVL